MTDEKPRRAQTYGGENRHSRRTPTAGAPVEYIEEEVTPPPTRLPSLVGRTPTPDDGRFDRIERKVNELVDATGRTWGARDVDQRIGKIELELNDNTKSTIRMEAVLGELVVPTIKEQMAKLDTCLHHIASSSHLAASVVAIGSKLDGIGARFDGIEKKQAIAAEKFEAHDARDGEIHEVAKDAVRRITLVEKRLAIHDTTAKIRKAIMPWWKADWVKAIGLAVAAAITAATAYYLGGSQ
jgi:hypothetical protein